MLTNRSALSRPTSLALALAVLNVIGCEEAKEAPDTEDTSDTAVPACEVLTTTPDSDLEVDGCLEVMNTVDINTRLHLAAGTIVYMADDAALWIGPEGSIVADGTEEAPVRFEGMTQEMGAWRGLIVNSPSVTNTLTYTEIAHAGGDSYYSRQAASLAITGDGVLSVDHVTLELGAGLGLLVENEAEVRAMEALWVRSHSEALASVVLAHLGVFGGEIDGGENDAPRVDVREVRLDDDLVITALDVPYRLTQTVDVYADVEVGPGTQIEVDPDVALWFAPESTVRMLGGAETPITFTGVAGADSWRGIVVASSDPTNVFDGVRIEGAGSDTYYHPRAAALCFGDLARGTVSNTSFSDTGGVCIDIDTDAHLTLSSNTYAGCSDASVSVNAAEVGDIDPASQHDGPVRVRDGNIQVDSTVSALDVPYLFEGTVDVDDGVITFLAGADLMFESDSAIWFGPDSGVRVNGTAAAPVVFRSAAGLPAGWRGMVLSSSDPANAITHAELREGGSQPYYCSGAANLCVNDLARIALSDVLFADSDDWGLYREPGSIVTSTNVSFSGNVGDEYFDAP